MPKRHVALASRSAITSTVNILGRELTGRIANLREIDWQRLDINFVMVFSPGMISGAPQTHIATVRVDPDKESALVKELAARYPNISAIRVKDAISTATRILDAVGWAVRAAAGIALVVGALVLAGAMATGQQRRIYEAVLLKMLGGTRRDVALGYLTEFTVLAGLSAIFALGVGSIGAYFFLTKRHGKRLDIRPAADPGHRCDQPGAGAGARLCRVLAGLGRACGTLPPQRIELTARRRRGDRRPGIDRARRGILRRCRLRSPPARPSRSHAGP